MAEYREFQDGDLIGGTRYRVLRLIGAGGMGTVYEVEHVELGKRFVLKALLRELSRREDLVIRLRNEWRALGRLEHPNIVTVTDAGTSATGVPFYVMERLDGETLSQRMRQTRRFAVRDALEIAIGILEGLSAAHEIGVVHRDVKPPNIFILQDGRPKILDFGVAKVVHDPGVVTARGIAVGTPRYMSPEQARGDVVDGRADIYSTGLILFESIAGVGPFDDARDANDLILAHLVRHPPQLSSLAMDVTPELDAAAMNMLAKNRDQRPRTALAAAQILRRILGRSPRVVISSGLPASAAYDATVASPPPSGHDTTRPDGVAGRSTGTGSTGTGSAGTGSAGTGLVGTPTSVSVSHPSSWMDRPTIEQTALDPSGMQSARPNVRSWSKVSANTLVGLPSTDSHVVLNRPESSRPASSRPESSRSESSRPASSRSDTDGRVPTEILPAVSLSQLAVTRTQLPRAAFHSETPLPVAPSEPPPARAAATSPRAVLWLGSALAGVATLAVVMIRPGALPFSDRTVPSAARPSAQGPSTVPHVAVPGAAALPAAASPAAALPAAPPPSRAVAAGSASPGSASPGSAGPAAPATLPAASAALSPPHSSEIAVSKAISRVHPTDPAPPKAASARSASAASAPAGASSSTSTRASSSAAPRAGKRQVPDGLPGSGL